MSLWLLETMLWTDVLDIAIIAYLIYRALRVIWGTRATQTLGGLFVMMLLFFVADRLELVAIHWLLGEVFGYIVLAVIILFQDDIRRALARAGGQIFTGLRGNPTDLPMLEELVQASFALASRRVGALIVIERQGSLAEYIDPSTRIDAVVTQDLLLAIFHHTSPLHDGAVIIQKSRIAAAKAFLPLTRSKNVSPLFGTRHRAAIGLTEVKDALIIVVSEERGTVAVAQDGEIKTTVDANALRESLQQIFATDTATQVAG